MCGGLSGVWFSAGLSVFLVSRSEHQQSSLNSPLSAVVYQQWCISSGVSAVVYQQWSISSGLSAVVYQQWCISSAYQQWCMRISIHAHSIPLYYCKIANLLKTKGPPLGIHYPNLVAGIP